MEKTEREQLCPFCAPALMRHHALPIMRRGTHWLVTPNKFPYKGTRSHLLFISKKHIEHLTQVSGPAWRELGTLLAWAAKREKIDGGSVFMRFGDTDRTGATIRHLHAHLLTGGPGAKKGKRSKPIDVRLGFFK